MPSRVFTEGIGHTNETVSATVDSSGNLVMAKDIKLPAAGGIKDSSGNNLLTEAGSAVTLSDKVIPANSFMFRNKIINGNFDFWQRGTSQTSSGYGSTDRWGLGHATSSKTASQQSFANGQTDVPNNPKYYLRHVITSSSGGYVYAGQPIEGVETLSGKSVTFSFYAKTDSNKSIATELQQYFGSGGSPSSQITGIGVTTHNLTTSWQKFTVTTTIPSISGKTIGTNSNDYLALNFWFEAGSSLNSRTNSLGNQSGTFDIAQVQLEEGSSATPFEHRPIGMELSLCQRYFCKTGQNIFIGRGNSNSAVFGVTLPVSMRSTPTIAITNGNIVVYDHDSNESSSTDTVTVNSSTTTDGFGFRCHVSGVTAPNNRVHAIESESTMTFSSEL